MSVCPWVLMETCTSPMSWRKTPTWTTAATPASSSPTPSSRKTLLRSKSRPVSRPMVHQFSICRLLLEYKSLCNVLVEQALYRIRSVSTLCILVCMCFQWSCIMTHLTMPLSHLVVSDDRKALFPVHRCSHLLQ